VAGPHPRPRARRCASSWASPTPGSGRGPRCPIALDKALSKRCCAARILTAEFQEMETGASACSPKPEVPAHRRSRTRRGRRRGRARRPSSSTDEEGLRCRRARSSRIPTDSRR
jgi:hypothetical protein